MLSLGRVQVSGWVLGIHIILSGFGFFWSLHDTRGLNLGSIHVSGYGYILFRANSQRHHYIPDYIIHAICIIQPLLAILLRVGILYQKQWWADFNFEIITWIEHIHTTTIDRFLSNKICINYSHPSCVCCPSQTCNVDNEIPLIHEIAVV